MATPWWAKVSAGGPLQMGAYQARSRTMSALIAGTKLGAEPEVGAAFLNANVPYSLALRADATYQAKKANDQRTLLNNGGLTGAQTPTQKAAANTVAPSNEDDDWWITKLAKSGWGAVRSSVGWAGDRLNEAFSILQAPEAAGAAAPDTEFEKFLQKPGYAGAAIPLTPQVTGLAEGAIDYFKGWGNLLGITDLSEQQKQQMRAGGYDPDSFASRYAWYYDDWNSIGNKPVGDNELDRLRQQYDPAKVGLALEVANSNFLNDNNEAALSPEAQKFVKDIAATSATDSPDKKLLETMIKSSSLSLGGHVANNFNLEPGTGTHAAVSALFDIVGYWKVDPIVGAGKLYKEAQWWRYGAPADDLMKVRDKIAAISDPANLSSAPATPAGKAFDSMLDTADQIYVLQKAGDDKSLSQAAQLANKFTLEHPDMTTHFGLVMQLRSGAISGVAVKPAERLADEGADGVKRGYQLSPVKVVAPQAGSEMRPVWALRSAPGEQVDQLTRNTARAKVAELVGDVVWLEAVGSGRPFYRGQVMLPGQIAINRRIRSAMQPLRDGLTRADKTFVSAMSEARGRGVARLDGELDRPADVLVSNGMGEWVKNNYRTSMGNGLARVAANFDKSFSGKKLAFDTPEGVEVYRRLVTAFLPRRVAYAAVNEWAAANPARRMALYRQTAEAIMESAGLRNSPAMRQIVDIMTKGTVPAADDLRRTGPLEAYTADAADNLIKAGDHEIASGVHSFQMSDAVTLPNLREIRQLQQISGLFSATGHFFNSKPLAGPISWWKIGKVGNFANMNRQLAELFAFSSEQGIEHVGSVLNARRNLAIANSAERLAANDTARAANAVWDSVTTGELNALNKAKNSGDWNAYRAIMLGALEREGIRGRHAEVIAQLADDVDFTELTKLNGFSAKMLAFSGPADALRRVRLAYAERVGRVDVISKNRPWTEHIDAKFADDITSSALNDLDSAADAYPMLSRGSYVDDIMEGVNKGFGFKRARIPNTYEMVGTAGDRGAQYWAAAQGVRQRDPIGGLIQQAIALEARLPKIKETRIARAAREREKGAGFQALNQLAAETRADAAALRQALVDMGRTPPTKADPFRARMQKNAKAIETAQAKVDDAIAAGKDKGKAFENLKMRVVDLKDKQKSFEDGSVAWSLDRADWDQLAEMNKQAKLAVGEIRKARVEFRADAEKQFENLNPTTLLNESEIAKALARDPRLAEITDPAARKAMADAIRGATRQFDDTTITDTASLVRYLIGQSPDGEALRLSARRLQFTAEGRPVRTPQELAEAVDRHAKVMLKDHVLHMGGKINSRGEIIFPESLRPVINKLSVGRSPGPADFAKVPAKDRPDSVAAHLYIPDIPKPVKKGLVNMATKAYGFTVARPLSRLGTTPAFIANRDHAYRALEPVADALMKKGLSPEQAAGVLESAASRYAINATFRTTDQATEHSVFSELADNFLMFQRAFEDFTKRVMKVTAADPALIARAQFLTEAGLHSGLLYSKIEQDDEGNYDTNLTLTFPGSAAMMKTLQDFGRLAGWGDSDIVKQPLYSSLSAPVRFINPSLSNPLGFSTNPMIGLPLRITRALFPETDRDVTDFLSIIEGGGEKFFAEQDILQSLLPTPISRLVPALAPGEATGQLASAIRNAEVYYMAAGKLPGPEASDDEWEEAHDAIRSMAENQLVWRAVVAFFSPMAPGADEPQGLGLPDEPHLIDAVRGVDSIRSEWFGLIEQYSKKYGSAQGFSEAAIEWARRYPKGKSIVNPEAFTVGTTRAPGTAAESGSFSSGEALTQWMLENKKWIDDNRAVAYYLLPSDPNSYFSPAGQRAQLRNALREHKTTEEFMQDIRFKTGQSEWWEMFNRKSAAIAANPAMKDAINRDFAKWSDDWKIANPASARRMEAEQDPNYVHGVLAPAIERLLNSPTDPPAEIAKSMNGLREMYEFYTNYRKVFNSVDTSTNSGIWTKRALNKQYRDTGAARYLGTPLEDLWRKLDVYEEA